MAATEPNGRPTAADCPVLDGRTLLDDLRRAAARADPVPMRIVSEGRASLGWAGALADLRAARSVGDTCLRPARPLGTPT